MSVFTPSDLVVVIPTRDRWSILARTLAALREQTVEGFHVVVVVDGTDQEPPDLGTAEVVQVSHRGPGAARNAGVAATTAPLVLFLGDDMIPAPELVARHLAVHEAHPEATSGVAGHVRWHADVRMNRVLRWLDWSRTQFDFDTIVGDEAGWERFYSCNVSLKRALFESAGGFDPDFVYYYEDLDLGWRLHEHGLRLHYEPGALAYHLHEYTFERLQARFEGIAVGERTMADKHDWFEPFFAARIEAAAAEPTPSKAWTVLVDAVPKRLAGLRLRAEIRANTWYYQQLAPAFRRGTSA